MQYALAELNTINDNLSKKDPHPYLGYATLHPGKIDGGSAQSVIAAEATLYWERRTLPGEDQKQLDQELGQVITAVNDAPGNHKVSADQIFC